MMNRSKNAVDLLFDALEQKDPDHFALRQYKKYKLAAGKTAKLDPYFLCFQAGSF